MNWVGGTMSKIRGRDDKKIQREFFEKKRYEKTLDTIPLGLQSPTKKKELSISQDLLSLQTVLQTHREDNNRSSRPLKQPNKLDLKPKVGQKRMISCEVVQGSGGLVVEEGFQNLETPTSFLDVKRWRGENRPYKTLGMCKVPNLRHFQELEQTVYRREGVEVQAEKENLRSVEERDISLPLSEGVESADKDVQLRRDEERGSIQWNKNVCGESNNSGADTKWLEFLHGCNNTRQQRTKYLTENVHADITTQFPSVHLPLPSSRPLSPHLNPANLGYYEGEDLMEFERMANLARPQQGNSEDPLYLTLTCNKDSLKGYKRPRIDSNLGFTSGVGAGGRTGPGGYLDESVFTTPAEGNLIRPDGMLTENPLPQSHRVALRSIKDFVLERSPIEESEDSSVPLDLEENSENINGSTDLPEVPQPTVTCEHKQKGKFIAPFITKNKSPDVLPTASEEKRPSSKSFESFLHSLISSEETERGKSNCGVVEKGNIGLEEMKDVQEESCMMSIVEWKSKERTRKIEDVNKIRVDSVDKETAEKRGSYAMESVSSLHCRDENVERLHLEVELREREFDYGNQSVNEDENSIEFLSTHSTQGTNVEMKERELETELAENLDSLREDQIVGSTMNACDVRFEEYDTSDFVNEVINNAIRKMLSYNLFEKNSPNFPGANVENTQSTKLSLVTHNESFELNQIVIELDQNVEDTSLENTLDFGLNNSMIEDTKATDFKDLIVVPRTTEEDDLTMPVEYDEKAVQYSQQSPKMILMDTAVGSPLHTDSKYCQSIVRSSDIDCQTEDIITSNYDMISHETEVGTETASNIMLSQAIQTDVLLTRAEKEIQTDPTLADSERAADIRNEDNREDYENFIIQQQQKILALEKEIEVLKLNSDN